MTAYLQSVQFHLGRGHLADFNRWQILIGPLWKAPPLRRERIWIAAGQPAHTEVCEQQRELVMCPALKNLQRKLLANTVKQKQDLSTLSPTLPPRHYYPKDSVPAGFKSTLPGICKDPGTMSQPLYSSGSTNLRSEVRCVDSSLPSFAPVDP